MHIVVISVGKVEKDYWKWAINTYEKRLTKHCKLLNLVIKTEGKSKNKNDKINYETKQIYQYLTKYQNYQIFLLDLAGEQISSNDLALLLQANQLNYQSKLLFIIGGSDGVAATLKQNPQIKKIAFGRITLPHQLCLVVLYEQLYRVFQILNNSPYHK